MKARSCWGIALACAIGGACRSEGQPPAMNDSKPSTEVAAPSLAPAAKSSSAAGSRDISRVVRGALTTELVPETPPATEERLGRYLDVRRADFAGWDTGGEGLYVLTRLANVNQLHRVDAPLGMRRQLTFGREGVDGFIASRNTARRGGVLSADEAGSENTQLYALDARGTLALLTDGKSRNTSPRWSADGTRLAYSSTRRNSRDHDIWVFDAARPDAPHEIAFASSGLWSTLDWSPAGDRLLLLHAISETKSELVVIEPGKGVVQNINPSPTPNVDVAFSGAVFAESGAGVYYLSDAGAEFRRLWYRDLATGKDRLLDESSSWGAEQIAIQRNGSLLAIVLNEAGWSTLRLFDTRGQRFLPDPKLPKGVITRLEFSPDGRRLALAIDSQRATGDVFVLDVSSRTSGTVTRWTESELGGLDPEAFHAPELLEYTSFDQRKIPAFLLLPNRPGPHPVVISIHGGPESQARPAFSPLHEYMVSELGLAVILPNVRGSTGYGRSYTLLDNAERREDAVKDIGALLDWIGQDPRFDAKRVGVYGASYGGYMVLATGAMFPGRVAAIVDMVGISNFVTFLESTKEYRRDLRRVEYGDERNPELRALLERISPLTNASKITAPLFVAQGQNDPRVPLGEAEQIVSKVRAQGREVWYMLAANEGHGFQKRENRDAFYAATSLFFERHLLGR
jgi:dipeptidyl aminopeptidase/acylaminoacyl peptidase